MAKKDTAAKPKMTRRTPPAPPKGGPPTDEAPSEAGLDSVERSQTDPMEAKEAEAQRVEEEDEDATQYMPRNLDLDSMDKATLMQVAMRYFGRRLDDSQPESVMRDQLRQLMGGRQNRYSQTGL